MKTSVLMFGVGLIILGGSYNVASASVFSDDFNDGLTDGWWLGYSQHTPWVDGDWRIEDIGLPHNGVLTQDNGGDHFIALAEGIPNSSHTVETDIRFNQVAGYGGITVWYENDDHWVNVLIYPAGGRILVLEDGDTVDGTIYSYSSSNDLWYNLKVVVDSITGELDIYVDDVYVLTHTVTTTHRSGLSGVNSGNSGASFDNFQISWDDLVGPPTTQDQCKKSGWKTFNNPAFKNQGQCIQFLNK